MPDDYDDFLDYDEDYDEDYYDDEDWNSEVSMTQLTAKTSEEARKHLIDIANQWEQPTSTRLTCGLVFGKDGTITSDGRGGGCHGWVARGMMIYEYATHKKRAVGKYVLSAFPGDRVVSLNGHDEKVIRRWCEWFASDDNPLSKHLVERDPDFLYNYGMLVDCEDVEHAIVLWLVKTFRQPIETPELVRFWGRMVLDEGIDPLLAIYVAQRFSMSQHGIRPLTGSGHYCTFQQYYDQNLENLITRTVNKTIQESNCSNVFLAHSLKQGPLNGLVKKHTVKSFWGNTLELNGADERDIITATKKLEADLRAKVSPPPAPIKVKPRKMVRDKITGLMRPARKRRVKTDGIVKVTGQRVSARNRTV